MSIYTKTGDKGTTSLYSITKGYQRMILGWKAMEL